jgi:hypothetical protein
MPEHSLLPTRRQRRFPGMPDGRIRGILVGLTVLLAGCGSSGQQGASPSTGVSPPTGALAAWQGFPADQRPRPIVLLEQPPRWPGFPTNGGKIAALCQLFAAPSVPLPTETPPPAVVAWPDGTRGSYPSLAAADAYATMSHVDSKAQNQPQCATATPLQVTGVRLDTAEFITDRGRAQMPSWLFAVSGGLADAAYPAIAPAALWRGGEAAGFSGSSATIGPDDRRLTFGFTGSPAGSGPCSARYRAGVAESATAVAVAIETIPSSPPVGTACTVIAYSRTVTVILSRPLGGRVVVDASGHAIPVTRS